MTEGELRLKGAGKALTKLRGARSIEEVANLMGVDRTTLWRMEQNERGLSAEAIVKFSEALGLATGYVIKACLEDAVQGFEEKGGKLISCLLDALAEAERQQQHR